MKVNQDYDLNLAKELIDENSHVTFLQGENIKINNYIENAFDKLSSDYFIYKISCESSPTQSMFFVKQLIKSYIDILNESNSLLLMKHQKAICALMPWMIKDYAPFKDVKIGLDIPNEENPTSFTLSFVYQRINGLINFLLENGELSSKGKPILFMLSDIDKTDFASIRFIEQLIKRSVQANFYIILTYSEGIPENLNLYSKSSKIQIFDNGFDKNSPQNKNDLIRSKKYLINDDNDLSTKYTKALIFPELITEEKVENILVEAALYSQRNAYYEEAIYYVEHLIENYWECFNDTKKSKLLRIKGVSHVLLKQNDKALKDLEESIHLSKDVNFNAKVCYIIGSFITKHVNGQLGQEWLDKGFKFIEGLNDKEAIMNRIWLNNSRALIYFKNKDYNRAIQIEKENIQQFEKSFHGQQELMTFAILHYNIAYALFDQGKTEEAIGYMDKAIEIMPSHLDLYNNKANMLQDIGKYKDAIYYYEMVKQKDFPKDEVYLNCGNAHMHLENWDLSLENLDYSLYINPLNINTWNSIGYLNYLLKDYENAIKNYNKALEIDPYFSPALINRALAYEELNQIEDALKDYEYLENISLDSIEIHVNRASLYQKIGEIELAKNNLKNAITLEPNRAESYVNLAIIYDAENNYLEAKKLLEKATGLDKNNPWIYYNYAYILEKLGEFSKALEAIKNALTISPEEQQFKVFLNKLNVGSKENK